MKRRNWWKVIHYCPRCGAETAPVQTPERDAEGLFVWRPTPHCDARPEEMIERTWKLSRALEYVKAGATVEDYEARPRYWKGTDLEHIGFAVELLADWKKAISDWLCDWGGCGTEAAWRVLKGEHHQDVLRGYDYHLCERHHWRELAPQIPWDPE